MTNPIVVVDVDGVLANTIDRGLQVARRLLNRDDLYHDMIRTWAMEDSIGLQGNLREMFYSEWRRPLFVAGMEPYAFAVVGFKKLVEQPRLALVHPMLGLRELRRRDVDVGEGFLDHFGVPHERIIHTYAKHLIRADFLIEDKTSTLVKWKQYNPSGYAIRMARNYNRVEFFDGVQVNDMIEAATTIATIWANRTE